MCTVTINGMFCIYKNASSPQATGLFAWKNKEGQADEGRKGDSV